MFLFFEATATTESSTLSLHDALPIFPLPLPRRGRGKAVVDEDDAGAQVHHRAPCLGERAAVGRGRIAGDHVVVGLARLRRSEEHTSELQSHVNLVCRLLLEKKKKRR